MYIRFTKTLNVWVNKNSFVIYIKTTQAFFYKTASQYKSFNQSPTTQINLLKKIQYISLSVWFCQKIANPALGLLKKLKTI